MKNFTGNEINVTMGNSCVSLSGDVTASGTYTFSEMWGPLVFRDIIETPESVEIIYTQASTFVRTGGFPPYHDERAVKIIYRCIDGKWNKSEPIYGKVIPAQNEYYEFGE